PRTYNISLRAGEFVIRFDSTGRIVTNKSAREKNILDLREITLGQTLTDRRFQLKLPADDTFVDVVASPAGDRVLWHLRRLQIPSSWLEYQLMRLGWYRPAPSTWLDVLYMSNPDGRGMTEVGSVPADA